MRGKILHTILNYLNDKLSNKERHVFEKEENADPFLQDAMDGFEQLSADELESDLAVLNNHLSKRTLPPKKLSQFYRVAAAIALFIGIGSIALYITTTTIVDSKLAEETQIEQQKNELISPIEKEADIIPEEPIEVDGRKEILEKEESILIPIEKPQRKKEITSQKEYSEQKDGSSENIALMEDIQKEDENEMEIGVKENTPETTSTHKVSGAQSAPPSIAYSQSPISKKEKANLPDELIVITGSVLDENNEPIIGASVYSSDSENGTVTDYDGYFSIKVNPEESIQITHIGYLAKEVPVEYIDNKLDLQLQPDLLALDEVVVVGYATQKKSMTTSSVSVVRSSDISGTPPNDADTPVVYKARAVKFKYEPECDEQAFPEVGLKDYKKYIKKNFELTSDLPTKVIAEIEISSNGTINNIDITESPNENFKAKAYQLIENGSKWSPALLNRNTVNQKVTLTIKF